MNYRSCALKKNLLEFQFEIVKTLKEHYHQYHQYMALSVIVPNILQFIIYYMFCYSVIHYYFFSSVNLPHYILTLRWWDIVTEIQASLSCVSSHVLILNHVGPLVATLLTCVTGLCEIQELDNTSVSIKLINITSNCQNLRKMSMISLKYHSKLQPCKSLNTNSVSQQSKRHWFSKCKTMINN